MTMPNWQEIIDDILEVLTLRHPALQDNTAINFVTIGSQTHIQSKSKDEMMDDMLDVLVVHKLGCGHSIKVPKHLYTSLKAELPKKCQSCISLS